MNLKFWKWRPRPNSLTILGLSPENIAALKQAKKDKSTKITITIEGKNGAPVQFEGSD